MHRFICAIAAICATSAVYAADIKVGNLTVSDVWVRPSKGQVSAAYLTVKNSGAADKLLSANCDCAKATELHEMSMTNGVMKMDRVAAIDVPAKGEVALKPGGYHIMLIDLKRPLLSGENVPIKLVFEKAGETTLTATVTDQGGMMMH